MPTPAAQTAPTAAPLQVAAANTATTAAPSQDTIADAERSTAAGAAPAASPQNIAAAGHAPTASPQDSTAAAAAPAASLSHNTAAAASLSHSTAAGAAPAASPSHNTAAEAAPAASPSHNTAAEAAPAASPSQSSGPQPAQTESAPPPGPVNPFTMLVAHLQSGALTQEGLATFLAQLTQPKAAATEPKLETSAPASPPPPPAVHTSENTASQAEPSGGAVPKPSDHVPEPKAASPVTPQPAQMLAARPDQRINSASHPNEWRKFERFVENNQHASELKKMYSRASQLTSAIPCNHMRKHPATHACLHPCQGPEAR